MRPVFNVLFYQTEYSEVYQGECGCLVSCLKPCARIYAPVCGEDCNGNKKTFSNQCEMDNYNCEHPDGGIIWEKYLWHYFNDFFGSL